MDLTMFLSNEFLKKSADLKTLRLFFVACMSSVLIACSGGGSSSESPVNGSTADAQQEVPAQDGSEEDEVAQEDGSQEGGSQEDNVQQEEPPAPQIDPVVITAHPQTQTVTEGDMVTFTVSAQGGGELTYQWRKDGAAINGATASTLALSSADLADEGTYDVVVTNSVGNDTSLVALLTVEEIVPEDPVVSSVSLSWDIPLTREDGSDLELYEINGYVIAYGTSSGDLDSILNVEGASETSVVIDDLAANTYYFAIATVDSEGNQSDYSSVIQQQVM